MKIIHRRCAGLDVHKKTISVCVRVRVNGHKIEMQEGVFGTFTKDLERLRDWLKQQHVKQVAMESTGVYWIPVWNVLEASRRKFELLLVNPQTVRALRGNKTDRIDAARIAEYLQFGLLRASFVPPRPIRELRDLTRSRVQIQHDRNRVINRIARLLETANVKLSSTLSNIVGVSGRAILAAIVAGGTKPELLAERAVITLRKKLPELTAALQGRYNEHFRWQLEQLLKELEWLDKRVAEITGHMSEPLEAHADLLRRLDDIPGVDRVTACAIIAELGVDMTQFPDAAHAASWAGLCPGNNESAGKRFSGRTRKGDRYLRRVLVQSAWAVTRKSNCFLTALFYRVARKRGAKKAAVAVAHRILIIAYHIIRDSTEYREAGADFFDRQHPERTAARLRRRLEQCGYEVVLRQAAEHTPETVAAPPRRRGRPCLCAARGIVCPHGRQTEAGTCTPPRTRPTPKRELGEQPPIPGGCRKCKDWGIACIHVRNQKLHASKLEPASESTT